MSEPVNERAYAQDYKSRSDNGEKVFHHIQMLPNGGVDAAARIQSSIAARIKLRNTPPPLASNDLLDVPINNQGPADSTRFARGKAA